jgi:uncharacterized coiled-coil protein SlyX
MDDAVDRLSTLERAQRLHQEMSEQHEARLHRLDRNYDRMERNYAKLLDIAAEIAQTNDRMENQLLRHIRDTRDTVRRHDERLTLLEDIAARQQGTLERVEATLAAIKDMLGRPPNGR